MFGFFNAPRVSYNYYRPTIYRQRYVPIEAYLLNSIRQAQEYEKFKSLLYKVMIEQQREKEIHDDKENQPIDNNNNEEAKEDQKCEEKQTLEPFYYFESHSKFDGEKIVEEQKTRKTDSEGKIHQTLKRRLGDQWYQTEQIKDENGKTIVKESWHNVSENDVDNFKKEWMNMIGYQQKLDHEIEGEKEQMNESDEKESAKKIEKQSEVEPIKNETISTENKDEIISTYKNVIDNEEKNKIDQSSSNETEN